MHASSDVCFLLTAGLTVKHLSQTPGYVEGTGAGACVENGGAEEKN